MSLLSEIIKENAAGGATGAGAIAAAPGRLGDNSQSGFKKKSVKRRMAKIQRLKFNTDKKDDKVIRRPLPQTEGWQSRLAEMIEDEFDAADVASKLDAAEKRSRMADDTVPFGMEDEEGNIVKVYVALDQADDFEVALANALAGENEDGEDDYGMGDEEETSTAKEIAEVLFALKDKFNIIDVEWPTIEGDEEEEQEMAADEADMDFEGGDEEMDMEGGDGEEMDMEGGEDLEGEDLEGMEGDTEMEPEGDVEGTLASVIDMMKKDAEARAADAEARTKEAEARTAEANASAASSKVEQEEQILDMEAHDKQKKSEKGEAERLAKLAKYKHDQAKTAETKMAEEEEESQLGMEEPDDQPGSITKSELGAMIQRYLAAAN